MIFRSSIAVPPASAVIDAGDGQRLAVHLEVDFQTAELHAVDPLGVVLVGGAGVVFQHTLQRRLLVGRHFGPEGVAADHVQVVEPGLRCETCRGIRVAVGVGDIGFDVVDGGAVHQVGAPHDEDGADVGPVLDGLQPDAGQAQRVGPEGGAGGKDAHPGVAAETGRADGGRPALPHRAGELPHQPDVAEIFQPAHGVGAAVFGGEDDLAPQTVHQPALAGDAEFGGEGGADMGDDLEGHFFGCRHKQFSLL